MSQSPEDTAPEDGAVRYRQGWKALNRLLHEDRSFSGRERHCAFINCGGGRFADASAAAGFDYPDDGRALAAADWDFDGDLDVWTTCRTAPRLRFLQNRGDREGARWVALRPHGDGDRVNRDAVGAEVRVWVKGRAAPLWRSVHAGDAFLTGAGSWLHFGLGEGAEIERVAVRWPGQKEGAGELFAGVAPGGFYELKSGAGEAERWRAPAVTIPELPVEPLPDAEIARVVLPARLPLPAVGGMGALRGPLLLTLWSAGCNHCSTEMAEWTAAADRVHAAGLRVLAWNADPEPAAAPEGWPFESAPAPEGAARALDLFQRAVLDRWTTLPVPCGFLLDRSGEVAIIYKGPFAPGEVLDDIALLEAPPEHWRISALPFAGRFIGPPPEPGPLRVASQFVDAAQARAGLDYLRRYAAGHQVGGDVEAVVRVLEGELEPEAAPAAPGAAALAAADALRDAGDAAGALAAYKEVLRQHPRTLAAAEHLAWLLLEAPDESLRSPEEALALAERLCAISQEGDAGYLKLRAAASAAVNAAGEKE